jgi:hypothetical protein
MNKIKNLPKPNPATFESVWAALQETDRMIKESGAKFDQKQVEYQAAYEKRMAKYEDEYQKRMGKMEENMGNWSNNHGSFAEEYFFNSFENEQQDFFGEHFNDIENNLKVRKQKLRDEYDIVMYNDSCIAIVESKFKAHKNDIPKVLKKAETFKILCPDYKDYKIYLGLASLSFYPAIEQACIKHGIAVIKQVGDTVVINDTHLKVY